MPNKQPLPGYTGGKRVCTASDTLPWAMTASAPAIPDRDWICEFSASGRWPLDAPTVQMANLVRGRAMTYIPV